MVGDIFRLIEQRFRENIRSATKQEPRGLKIWVSSLKKDGLQEVLDLGGI